MKTKTDLEGQKTALLENARTIAAKAESEGRNLTGEERTSITTMIEDAKALHAELLELDGDAKLREELNVLGAPIGSLSKGATLTPQTRKTVGETFTEAPEVRSWLKSIAPTGTVPDSAKGIHSPAVALRGGLKDILSGSVVSGDGAAGALVPPDFRGLLDGLGAVARPLVLRDLVTIGQTDTDQVSYARVVGMTNNAAAVAEATGASTYSQAEGNVQGLKPESALELEAVTANVKTLAHWLPATKRALSDAAQIRTLIDSFLNYGLVEELEDQMIDGDGTGENLEGILSTSGVQTQPFETDLLTTARKAKTLVRIGGRSIPTAYVLNPADNERFDLLREDSGGTSGPFLFGGPGTNGVSTLWGLPRVESEAVPEGTAIVADWRKAVLWDRGQAAIQVSDSHSDFFVRNLVAILGEMRVAYGILRPAAFATFSLEAGS